MPTAITTRPRPGRVDERPNDRSTTTTTTRRSHDVRAHDDLRLYLAKHYRDHDLRSAADARQLRDRSPERPGARARIGHSIIRLGERLANESPLEPAGPC